MEARMEMDLPDINETQGWTGPGWAEPSLDAHLTYASSIFISTSTSPIKFDQIRIRLD